MARPRKYTVKQLEKKIDEYFEKRKEEKLPYTVSGLCLHIGISKQTMSRWSDDSHELSDSVKRAKLVVEDQVETKLLHSSNPTGPIFWLKNFGWTDTQSVTVTKSYEELMEDTWPKAV